MRLKWSKLWPALIGALIASGVGVVLVYYPLGRGLVNLSYDVPLALRQRFQPPPVPQDAVIIYIDGQSADRLKQEVSRTWERSLHAKLLNRLTADGARSVTYDIFFADPSPPEKKTQDEEFAQSIKRNGRVVLGADFSHLGYEKDAGAIGMQIMPPLDIFSESAANLASVETNPDNDLVIRRHLPFSKLDLVPPLAWAAAELAGASSATSAVVRATERWINYYGPPRSVPSFSFYRAVSEDPLDLPLPPGFFKDKSVFIGGGFVTRLASDRKDEFATPFWLNREKSTDLRFMAGVEMHATVFLNLLRGEWLTRTPGGTEFWLMLGSGAVLGFSLTRLRPVLASMLAVSAAAMFAVIGYVAVTHYLTWYPWAIPVLAIIPTAWGWSVFYNSVSLYVQKRVLEQSLSRYLSPKLVRIFANRPEFLKTGADKQLITILFSDIANFTSLSEGMDGDQLAKSVNSYFDRAVPSCIFKTDGTVMKFIGDAIFAIWNAPETQSDHHLRACRAALLLRDEMSDFKLAGSDIPLRTRIGLHTGIANVGNFGSAEKFGYDAIGESINLASRMEGLNKHLGTDVLITGETHQAIDGQLVSRRLGSFRLKGFEKAVEVFELVSEPEKAAESKAWRENFAEGLKRFVQREFTEAETAFHRVLELKPGDGPSSYYLERITELETSPPGPDWTGVIELKEK
ncbi:MAG: adenylate/guanylate cyclase domain-containing protein [Pedosphaera sp.]|nr:adenylate/guanylate cyclase domain-containing protein [Pedosphaera sp.]